MKDLLGANNSQLLSQSFKVRLVSVGIINIQSKETEKKFLCLCDRLGYIRFTAEAAGRLSVGCLRFFFSLKPLF